MADTKLSAAAAIAVITGELTCPVCVTGNVFFMNDTKDGSRIPYYSYEFTSGIIYIDGRSRYNRNPRLWCSQCNREFPLGGLKVKFVE